VATSYNKLHALQGDYPYIVLDYPKLRISSGPLPMPLSTIVELAVGGIEVNWSYADGDEGVWSNDQTVILLHYPDLDESISMIYGADRMMKTQFIALQEAYRTAWVEIYLSFISADRSLVATSNYLGRLN